MTQLVDKRVPEGTYSQVLKMTSADFLRFKSIKKIGLILIDIVILHVFWVSTSSFSASAWLGTFWESNFNFLKLLSLAKDHK